MDKTTIERIYNKLSTIDLTDKIKEKLGLKYLSWAYAWDILKKNYPDAEMIIYDRKVETKIVKKTEDSEITTTYYNDVPYFTDGRTCWVKVGVKIEGIEQIETYPVMDLKNNAVKIESISSVQVNKAIQRAFVKACARHGLGMYIYAGEDLPEEDDNISVIVEKMISITDTEKMPDNLNFDELKQKVINNYTKIVEKVKSKIVNEKMATYIQEQLKGTRITRTTTEQQYELYKINSLLVKIIGEFVK